MEMPALFAAIGLGSGDIPETEGAKTVKKPQGLKREHLRYKCDTGFGLFRREDLGINYWRGFKGFTMLAHCKPATGGSLWQTQAQFPH